MNPPRPDTNPPASPTLSAESLSSCVHCGFCLEACPTYRLTGDENNSPRGRLRLWKDEAEQSLAPDPWTDFYTSQCIGCLACEPVCPAGVPYGRILEETRHSQVAARRWRPRFLVRLAAALAARRRLLGAVFLPARILRRLGLLPHPLVFPGRPAAFESTAAYARELVRRRRPSGPTVALLTGCVADALFREINFATVRVLVEHGVRVVVPENQGCCGAIHEHTGLDGFARLEKNNRTAFTGLGVECVVTNAAGCGLALSRALAGCVPVRDVLGFLAEIGPRPRPPRTGPRVYVDQPCHLVHGQRGAIPPAVLDATGYRWEYAPRADDCCGSGGFYNLQNPAESRAILAAKAAFLETAAGDPVILATANQVCMMQWYSAGRHGIVRRPYHVRHVIQLLDPLAP